MRSSKSTRYLKIFLASCVIFGTSYHQYFPSASSYKAYGNNAAIRDKSWAEKITIVLSAKNKKKEDIEEEIQVTYIKDTMFLSVPIIAMLQGNWAFYVQYGLANALIGASVEGLKLLVSRERPDKTNKKSFPSGHGSIAGLAMIGATYLMPKPYSTLYLLPFAYISMSRVHTKRHNISDVIAGVLISIAYWHLTTVFLSFCNRKSKKSL